MPQRAGCVLGRVELCHNAPGWACRTNDQTRNTSCRHDALLTLRLIGLRLCTGLQLMRRGEAEEQQRRKQLPGFLGRLFGAREAMAQVSEGG